MSREERTVQYTVRGVPPEVDKILRQRAARTKRSLNQVIVDELMAATSVDPPRADFSDVIGKWTPDPAFDEIVSSMRQVDPEKWK